MGLIGWHQGVYIYHHLVEDLNYFIHVWILLVVL